MTRAINFTHAVPLTLALLPHCNPAHPPQACRLRYTPRKLLIQPEARLLIIAEADHAAVPLAEREDLQVARARGRGVAGVGVQEWGCRSGGAGVGVQE